MQRTCEPASSSGRTGSSIAIRGDWACSQPLLQLSLDRQHPREEVGDALLGAAGRRTRPGAGRGGPEEIVARVETELPGIFRLREVLGDDRQLTCQVRRVDQEAALGVDHHRARVKVERTDEAATAVDHQGFKVE